MSQAREDFKIDTTLRHWRATTDALSHTANHEILGRPTFNAELDVSNYKSDTPKSESIRKISDAFHMS